MGMESMAATPVYVAGREDQNSLFCMRIYYCNWRYL